MRATTRLKKTYPRLPNLDYSPIRRSRVRDAKPVAPACVGSPEGRPACAKAKPVLIGLTLRTLMANAVSGVAPASGFASRPRAAPGLRPRPLRASAGSRLTLCAPSGRAKMRSAARRRMNATTERRKAPAYARSSLRSSRKFQARQRGSTEGQCAIRCSVPLPLHVTQRDACKAHPAPQTMGAIPHALLIPAFKPCTAHSRASENPESPKQSSCLLALGPRLRGDERSEFEMHGQNNGDIPCHVKPSLAANAHPASP